MELAEFIKETHKHLRKKVRNKNDFDVNLAWSNHKKGKAILRKYSEAMHSLAIDHWDSVGNKSRINWIHSAVIDYFYNDGIHSQMDKEYRKVSIVCKEELSTFQMKKSLLERYNKIRPLRVIDVGSCYNPFKIYEEFDVLPIDLCPATTDVVECDFLLLDIIEKPDKSSSEEAKLKNNDVLCKGSKSRTIDRELELMICEAQYQEEIKLKTVDVECEEQIELNTIDSKYREEIELKTISLDCKDKVKFKATNVICKKEMKSKTNDVECEGAKLNTTDEEEIKSETGDAECEKEVDLRRNYVQYKEENKSKTIDSEYDVENSFGKRSNEMSADEKLQDKTKRIKHSCDGKETNSKIVKELPEESFDVVIFCLFLEYIPCPKLRHKCCLKAYRLLKTNGVLCIITPDSKHDSANSQLFKLWKITLELLGFGRILYEKCPHFHGMVFRKGIIPLVWVQDAKRELDVLKSKKPSKKLENHNFDSVVNSLFIIQDFSDE